MLLDSKNVDLLNCSLRDNAEIENISHSQILAIKGEGGIINANDQTNFIEVDPTLDYQLSLSMKKSEGQTLSVGIIVLDAENNPLVCVRLRDRTSSNYFVKDGDIIHSDGYSKVDSYIFNSEKPFGHIQPTCEMNKASCLILPHNAAKIFPIVTISEGEAHIHSLTLSRYYEPNLLSDPEHRNKGEEEIEEDMKQRIRMANNLRGKFGGGKIGSFISG